MADFQTPEELQSHYGEEGPVAAALEWMRLVVEEGDLRAAWPLTDPPFRWRQAMRWVGANVQHPALAGRDLKALVDELASESPDDDLFDAFSDNYIDAMREATANYPARVSDWSAASKPRLIAPDYEKVLLAPTSHDAVLEDTQIEAKEMVMHFLDGRWLYAGDEVEAHISAARSE
jgi:hypothetical protein